MGGGGGSGGGGSGAAAGGKGGVEGGSGQKSALSEKATVYAPYPFAPELYATAMVLYPDPVYAPSTSTASRSPPADVTYEPAAERYLAPSCVSVSALPRLTVRRTILR